MEEQKIPQTITPPQKEQWEQMYGSKPWKSETTMVIRPNSNNTRIHPNLTIEIHDNNMIPIKTHVTPTRKLLNYICSLFNYKV